MNYKSFRKKSKYDREKQNKMDNYTYLNLNYCKKGQTVLLGDSITEIFNDRELFAEYTDKTGIAVYNRGISGDTSDRLLERLEDNVINIEPKNVVLLIGTNDFGIKADIQYVFGNIKQIILRLKEKCPNVNIVLEGILPVNNKMSPMGYRNNKKYLEINKMLYKLSTEEKINYFDLTEELSDDNGCLDRKYTYDGLHLNAKGFEITANKILEFI